MALLLIILGIILTAFALIEQNIVSDIRMTGKELFHDTSKALKRSGELAIREKAGDIAKQIDLFIRLHKGVTVGSLQRSGDFNKIALQRVGDSGYSSVIDMKTGVIVVHPDRASVGMSLKNIAIDSPQLLDAAGNKKEIYGYYKWRDSDGVVRDKFMYLERVKTWTSDGVQLGVIVTIYFSEFIKPIEHIEEKIEAEIGRTLGTLDRYLVIIVSVVLLTLALGIVVSFVHYSIKVKEIQRPIDELLFGTHELSQGNLDHRIKKLEPEEFNILASSFNAMTDELKQHRDFLEDEVQRRTAVIELSEHKYRNLVENTNDIVFSLNDRWEFITVNGAVKTELGFSPEEIVGKPIINYVHMPSAKNEEIDRLLFLEKLESLRGRQKIVNIKTFFKHKFSEEPRELRLRFEYIDTPWGSEFLGKASSVGEDSLADFLRDESQTYVINNYLINAENISQRVTRNLGRYMERQSVVNIRISIREMILNAIEHGNLEITFDEKSDAQVKGGYMKFIRERQKDPRLMDRKIRIGYHLSQEALSVTIRDEGKGFDHFTMLKKQMDDVFSGVATHGRGIMLAKSAFDTITYNERGNEVTLVKNFRKAPAGKTSA
jgi:PAS domain S-box-containing protein